jgi:glyoxylase-like metal-dependent hydrolase (beta-lactamase superfamily II)
MTPPNYEVCALRFATTQLQPAEAFLVSKDIHDGPLPLDFFVWTIRGAGRTIVVDTGFGHEASIRRNRPMIRHPVEALSAIGVDASTVADIILTHLHCDHSGNAESFPNATFHVQDSEVAYATGRHMCYPALNAASDVENVLEVVRNVYAGRVCFHDGDDEFAPGVTVHRTGGHTGGMQVVRVHTARGWVVLASDAAHFYRNFLTNNPFPIVVNIGEVLEGNRILLKLADSRDHVIPGHDPEVMKRYPAHPDDRDHTVCVHLPPRGDAG